MRNDIPEEKSNEASCKLISEELLKSSEILSNLIPELTYMGKFDELGQLAYVLSIIANLQKGSDRNFIENENQ